VFCRWLWWLPHTWDDEPLCVKELHTQFGTDEFWRRQDVVVLVEDEPQSSDIKQALPTAAEDVYCGPEMSIAYQRTLESLLAWHRKHSHGLRMIMGKGR
jgi:hypothetical protein